MHLKDATMRVHPRIPIIDKGGHRETLSVAEANDPRVVQTRFGLGSRPAFVLLGKKEKRVDFGDLKANLGTHITCNNSVASTLPGQCVKTTSITLETLEGLQELN